MVLRVSDALHSRTVILGPTWDSFEETIDHLVQQLVAAERLPASLAGEASQRVRERESIAGTAMVDIGVSIPHARLAGTEGIVAAMAVSRAGVYHVADGVPISIVVLVMSSPALTGEHLNFLSGVSMLLQSARTRERLRQAQDVEEVLALVRDGESGRG
jgi:mannitol/fructose-specific phosphotransferase system IIA component (Ntr-type)